MLKITKEIKAIQMILVSFFSFIKWSVNDIEDEGAKKPHRLILW